MMLSARCCAQAEPVDAPAPAILAVGETAWVGGTSWPATCVAPTGVAVGNLLVAFVVLRTDDNACVYTTSAGWTRAVKISQITSIYYEVLYRVADGGSDDTLTISRVSGANYYVAAHILRVSNASAVAITTSTITPSTTTPTCPELSVAPGNDCLWLSALAGAYNRPTITPPSGYTFMDTTPTESSGRPHHYLCDKSGNTGTEAAHSFVNVTSGFYGVAATVCLY